MIVSRLRTVTAGISPGRSGLDPWPVLVGFVMERMALGQDSSEYFGVDPSASVHKSSTQLTSTPYNLSN